MARIIRSRAPLYQPAYDWHVPRSVHTLFVHNACIAYTICSMTTRCPDDHRTFLLIQWLSPSAAGVLCSWHTTKIPETCPKIAEIVLQSRGLVPNANQSPTRTYPETLPTY